MNRKTPTMRGVNLRNIREGRYKKATDAVRIMNRIGIDIDYRRYIALETGAYPNQSEAEQITNFFGVTLDKWLLGIDKQDPPAYCDTLEGLPPKTREMIKKMVEAGSEYAKKNNIGDIT